jgi:hypothetical protein
VNPDRFLIGRDDISDAVFDAPILFDTNVWLLTHGPFIDLRDVRTKRYSWFYKTALENRATLLLPQIVVSEFVNRSTTNFRRLT